MNSASGHSALSEQEQASAQSRTVLVVIHGTFAKGAMWTRRDSVFVESIQNRIGFDQITTFEWSGANTISARLKGADLLEKHIKALERSYPNCRIITVAHSHGGSVVAYWLKQASTNVNRLAGQSFISTPFIGIRISHHWYALVCRLLESCESLLIVSLTIGFVVSVVRYMDFGLFIVSALIFGAVIGVGFRRLVVSIAEQMPNVAGQMDRYARHASTLDVDGRNALFVRVTGDEAAAALATSQFGAWLLASIQTLLLTTLSKAKASQDSVSRLTHLPAALWVAASTGSGFILLASIYFQGVDRVSQQVGNSLVYFTMAVLALIWVAGLLLDVLLLGLFAVSVVVAALLFLPFGRALPILSAFMQVSVEPIPWGSHTLLHLRWREEKNAFHADKVGMDLSHSDGYQLDEAIQKITQWMQERLGGSTRADVPHTVADQQRRSGGA